jgi:hypothetical protein
MCPTIKDVVAINNRVKEYLMEKGWFTMVLM